jgi:hypothetical protein
MTASGLQMKRYTLLRRADAQAAATTGPGVRRLTLVRRAQSWPPLPGRPGSSRA